MRPGGLAHLILEVVAYAADEAQCTGGAPYGLRSRSTADGSVSVADEGRGTDTRLDAHGRPVRKPITATKDLWFFAHPGEQILPAGRPRRGMSVVAALSRTRLGRTGRAHHALATHRPYLSVPIIDHRA
ncbi:hypothetical protein [Streptomyces sp. A1547]|uniref:hypothetical protein n=1 Tax=Streptomyces sp. A1547 TaxID=2563105 RepID=UPI0019D17103|nr:hypothetical protein [Streptomyces sp. A1547]